MDFSQDRSSPLLKFCVPASHYSVSIRKLHLLPPPWRLCRNWGKGKRILKNGTDRRVRKL
jgi:hypothetical protein